MKELIFLEPVFKNTIWGGRRLETDFHYDVPDGPVGECWGISAHPNGDCRIAEGTWKGKHLSELWAEHRELFGGLRGERFPLLVKIIDAKEDLSIQVHPNDAYADRCENHSLGKTECWYVLDAEPDEKIVIGHHAATREQARQMAENREWKNFIREIPVKQGDFFQITPGTLHAIKGGTVLLETQQSSDVTYRFYDYDRLYQGKPRETHVQKCLDVLTVPFSEETTHPLRERSSGEDYTEEKVVSCPYYWVKKVEVDGRARFYQKYPFLCVSVIDGEGEIDGHPVRKGTHLIIPSDYGRYEVSGKLTLICSAVPRMIGALEAGGTKMVCAVCNESGQIADSLTIPTATPEETVPKMVEYFRNKVIDALGIACFGPVDVHPDSQTYGTILQTPKLAWRNYDILKAFRDALSIPVGLDTDVNGSCLGEMKYGCARGIEDVLYLTVGTGIGMGAASGGHLIHGMLHPEAGHLYVTPAEGDTYPGRCPNHGTCLEGMASGPAIEERWGAKAQNLRDRPEVWELESEYLAQALVSYIMVLSPKKIILGGGVMHQEQLFPLIREKVKQKINGYLDTPELKDMDNYIVPNSLNDNQGILGAMQLGLDALEKEKKKRG